MFLYKVNFQVQSIVDQHHQNIDAKTATKVRFQEPGTGDAEPDNKQADAEPTNEVIIQTQRNQMVS